MEESVYETYVKHLCERDLRAKWGTSLTTIDQRVNRLVELQRHIYRAFERVDSLDGPVIPDRWRRWKRDHAAERRRSTIYDQSSNL